MAAASPSFARSSRRPALLRPFAREQDLYEPVKRFLEDLGYEVKGEVRGCDVVAVRRGASGEPEPPIVVELKLAFTLGFVLQGVDRVAVTDLVYLAAPTSLPARRSSSGREPHSPTHPAVRRLCRRLGLGLLAVHPAQKDESERVEVICDPYPPAGQRPPRKEQGAGSVALRGARPPPRRPEPGRHYRR